LGKRWRQCIAEYSQTTNVFLYIFASIENALAVFARDGEGCLKGEEEMSHPSPPCHFGMEISG